MRRLRTGLALVLAFFALVALTVGLVIALTPMIGALGATLAVFGGLLVIALVCGLAAASQERRSGFKDPLAELHMKTLQRARDHILRALDDVRRGTTGRVEENVAAAMENLAAAIQAINVVLATGI